MTEKQYKGIAGNFLICDVQKEYAEHLLSILVKRFGMRFQFHFFSNVKKIEQFAEKAEIEILLIAEDCVSEIRGNVKAKKKFILSESMKKEEKQGETTIFRYQSANEILKIIQSGIGEEEAKAAHKPQKKTEEKYDAVQSDFTAPKRKIGIRDEPEESGLIGIYSPIHRIGKTEFALCLGEKISEKVPTLYINMEGYSGNDFYFKGEKNQDLGDLLYYLKQERIDYGGKLETASHKAYDFTVDSKRYQVKARVAKKGKITGSLSDIHHWEFDYLVVVLYNEDGTIKLVKELTEAEAEQLAYKNTGREILSVSSVKRQGVGKDITADIKAKYGI